MKSLTSLAGFVDLPELLDRVENDEELLAELFSLFQNELAEVRKALELAIGNLDMPEIERTAHKLKGMLASLSVKRSASSAAAIESAAHASDLRTIRESLVELNTELAGFSSALDSYLSGAEI